MGVNRWRDEDSWPLRRAVATPFYLRTGGALSRAAPAEEPPDVYVYDPHDPCPSVGGASLLPNNGPRDRRAVEARRDVLVYTSEPLSEDVEVTGPVVARLHVATSALDTDFTAALVDVHPDGRAIGVADGILRLRYRDGFERERLAEPSRVYEIEVDLVATSYVFLTGHRIGVDVSSSSFPRFDRNPNHGGMIAAASASDFVPATQHVFHDAARPSHVLLPVVPSLPAS
jgi:putative CocE/NonD family hydrolase